MNANERVEYSVMVSVWKKRETDLLGECYLSKGKFILTTNCAAHFISQYLVEYLCNLKKKHARVQVESHM
jgi:hypothetical protein